MNIKIEKKIKDEADKILKQLGLSATDAVRVFLKKVVADRGIPFDLRLDREIIWDDLNEETQNSILEADKNLDKYPRYNTTRELFESMGINIEDHK